MKSKLIFSFLIISIVSFGQVKKTIEPCKKIEIIKIEIESKKTHEIKVINQNNNEIILTNDESKICFYLDSTIIAKSNVYYQIVGIDESWIVLKLDSKIIYDLKEFKKGYYTFMIREYNCSGDLKLNTIKLIYKKK